MRYIAIALSTCLIAGCGLHNFEAKTESPTQASNAVGNTGPFNSSSSVATTAVSDYQVCLNQYEGIPSREEYCHAKIWGGRPGQYSPYFGYPYGGYGYGAYRYAGFPY